MRKSAVGTVVFFFAAPGTVAGLIPRLIRGDESPVDSSWAAIAGSTIFILGLLTVIAAFVQFVREGGERRRPSLRPNSSSWAGSTAGPAIRCIWPSRP